MVTYANGKIYKIVCNTTGEIYIGSTCEPILSRRLAQHKSNYKQYLKINQNFVTSFNILKNNNYEIILVELYPCNSKDELHARERHYIETNECVNKRIPTRTDKEYCEANKDRIAGYMKQYWKNNKDKLIEKKKQYYELNKPDIRQKSKTYRDENKSSIKQISKKYWENNKEMIIEKNKQYYQNNKKTILEKNKQKYNCVCGSVICFAEKARHFKSKKHQRYLEQNQA